jgi:hypothetical protein
MTHFFIPFTDYSKAKDPPFSAFPRKCPAIQIKRCLVAERFGVVPKDKLGIESCRVSCGHSKELTKCNFLKAKPILPSILIGSGTEYKRLRRYPSCGR